MYSQPSNDRKQQPSSVPCLRVDHDKQRATTWFSKPSFFQLKSKFGFLSRSRSSKSHSSLSSDPSLSRAQSPSTMTSNDSIYAPTIVSNQAGVAIKKSSKVRTLVDAVSSKLEAPRPIHSTASQTTPDYRRPIPIFFATIPIMMVPGVCSLSPLTVLGLIYLSFF